MPPVKASGHDWHQGNRVTQRLSPHDESHRARRHTASRWYASVANFNGIWHKALIKAELPRMHFHDLRRSGNNAIAESGASTK